MTVQSETSSSMKEPYFGPLQEPVQFSPYYVYSKHKLTFITGVTEWRDDLKKVLKEAGGYGKETTFLFSEGQIKEEVFLQDIDSLLNSGEVPNLYAVDEQQEILEVRLHRCSLKMRLFPIYA
jgi:hypothetical protein